MAFKRFTLRLAGRLLLLGISLFALAWLLFQPGYHSLTVIAAVLFMLAAFEVWRLINRSNREIARFVNAAGHADFSQKFSLEGLGSGFDELGEAFRKILDRQRDLRSKQATDNLQLRALIEHIPIPLLTVHADNSISLRNNAARRLFGALHVTQLGDLKQFGESFHHSVSQAVPGIRELVTFSVEDVEYCLTLATTEVIVGSESERLISLQDIQTELDESQASAWQDLVRVLTHEIMNSITPVTSLAKTAEDVVEEMQSKTGRESPLADDLMDLHEAVTTLANRSDSLMQFVDSYRQITRLAPPNKQRIRLADLFESSETLARAEWSDNTVHLLKDIKPGGLDVYADRDLLEPVLLNLLRNAWQATQGQPNATIELLGRLNRRGHVVIEVRDNGPGVPDEISRNVFVPFFTTKPGGSGVGLALARQVMIAHGGFIRVTSSPSGGANFTLIF